MKLRNGILPGVLLAATVLAGVPSARFESRILAPVPIAITNNAVTAVTVRNRTYVVSFAGLTTGKSYGDVLDATFVLNVDTGRWIRAMPVPVDDAIAWPPQV